MNLRSTIAVAVATLGMSTPALAETATLTDVKGTVLVNKGAGFQVVKGDTAIAAGHTIRVVSGEALLVQGSDCRVPLPRQSTFVHPATALCAGPNHELAAGAGADLPARGAPLGQPPLATTVVPGTDLTPLGVVAGGLLGLTALSILTDDDRRRRDEGQGVSP